MKDCTGGHFIICFVEKDVEPMVLSTGPKFFSMMLVATIPMKLYDGVSNPTMVLLSCILEWVQFHRLPLASHLTKWRWWLLKL